MVKSSPKRNTGFTLVELLVVIGIIAILISILLPALTKVQRSGKQVACQSNMRQLAQWGMMYAQANRGILPTSNTNVNGTTPQWEEYSSADVTSKTWVSLAVRPPYNLVKLTTTGAYPRTGLLYCPEAVASVQPYRGAYGTSYALNEFLGGQKFWGSNPEAPTPRTKMLSPTVYWFAEADVTYFAATNNYDYRTVTCLSQAGNKQWWPWSWDLRDKGENFRGHPNYVSNFVFGDGHVEAMTRKQFESLGTEGQKRFMGKHY